MTDEVNHPAHYTQHPSGVECIDISEHLPANLANAFKYVWRAGLKGGPDKAAQDLHKAIWYLERERARMMKTPADRAAMLGRFLCGNSDEVLEMILSCCDGVDYAFDRVVLEIERRAQEVAQ